MKLGFNTEQQRALFEAMRLGRKFLPSQGVKPEDAVVQLSVRGSKLHVEVPSPDIAFRSSVDVDQVVEIETEPFYVSAQALYQIVSGQSGEGKMALKLDRDAGFLIMGRGTSRWQFPLQKDMLPRSTEELPKVYAQSVYGSTLHNAIEHVAHAVGDEDARAYLRSLDCKSGRVRACNGSMYAHYDTGVGTLSFSVPHHAVAGFRAYINDYCAGKSSNVEFLFEETQFAYHFATNRDSVSITKPSYDYPDLDAILVRRVKGTTANVLQVNRTEFELAVKNATLLTDKETPALHLSIQKESVSLRCATRAGSEASTTIPANWSSKAREAAFDVKRFKELLKSVPGSGVNMELRFGDDTRERKSPVVIEGESTWSMLNQVKTV
jgi:DNA polymerase III sliding clamp (beta) subunit (PCNA family)